MPRAIARYFWSTRSAKNDNRPACRRRDDSQFLRPAARAMKATAQKIAALLPGQTGPQFARFLLVGGFNTAAGYALYLALLWLGAIPEAAFTINWVVSVIWSYFLNAKFTFRARRSARKFALFPLTYLAQYVVGIAFLEVALWIGIPPVFAPLPGVIVTVPMTFLLMRRILRPPEK